MPLVGSKVATRFVVFAAPIFVKPKFTVTISPGSIAPLVQLSSARTEPLEIICGRAAWPQQALAKSATLSTYQPALPTLVSVPQRQRNWTAWLKAASGRAIKVVTNPPELPLQ